MSLEAHLGDACVVPLEWRRLASGADALAPLRQFALGVLHARREGRRAGGDGGDGGGEGVVVILEKVDVRCLCAGLREGLRRLG